MILKKFYTSHNTRLLFFPRIEAWIKFSGDRELWNRYVLQGFAAVKGKVICSSHFEEKYFKNVLNKKQGYVCSAEE